jgi:nitroreductase
MEFRELVIQNRSRRRFKQEQSVDLDTLRELVDLARLCPSGSNRQPLKFLLVNTPQENSEVFNYLGWAGYLKEWPGPEEGERPSAYIIVLGDTTISKVFGVDHGIAAQTIMLGAVEKGLGGCILGSINEEALAEALDIPDEFEVLLVLALGKPNEAVVIEQVDTDGKIEYWRDNAGVHHVPKRSLEDLILI